ncbi:MAG: oxygen-independent coproporphyrinogen III oxidase [Deltaproteobacteria bacterium]|nr:oxygen-independent coproporphyrinogen III oxidase [Deltaproteobacteria bacterium]
MSADLAYLEQVTPELLERHDRPGPRYTSYPTAVEFDEQFTAADYRERLRGASRRGDDPLSLYVHIPFCEQRCAFCGCNSIITKNRELAQDYLGLVDRELELLASHLPERRELMQYHWGGGTPTYLNVEQMAQLQAAVTDRFHIGQSAEVAIEVDPEVTTIEQLEVARKLGFNRLSIGIQDFTPQVLDAIGRVLTVERARELVEAARSLGFESVNFDLIYGLPHQRVETFGKALDQVIELRPDRLAVYSFAYVPWIRPNQKRIDPEALPDREGKFALFTQAVRAFLEAGYLQIGMDHFALPDDEMGRAVSRRRLYRNFMGYTVHRATDMLGVGVSSIGAVEGAFVQNSKKLPSYRRAIDEGQFPVERGLALSPDDLIRQRAITELMCNFYLDFAEVGADLGIDCTDYFAAELFRLGEAGGPVDNGFIEITDQGIEVLPLGRLFVRNVCMVFDRYLEQKTGDKPVFSRTV